MAAEIERNLLNHYRLPNLQPTEWPTREDESDVEEEAEAAAPLMSSTRSSRRMSRFASLDKPTASKSRHSASKELGEGTGNIVQKDEPDPLGIAPSVVQELRRRGLSVEENLKLRNRFMLSSTTFSPTLFLSQVHQASTTDDLLRGLDFLSRSIEKKSASLKVLVESNFERFVKAKATIDNVYTEMRTQGQPAPTPQSPNPSSRRSGQHSRVSSRGNAHFRNTSNPFSPATLKPIEDKRKNALTRESEYGVQGIKAPLIEVAIKAEEVWGPALGGRDREDELKSTLSFVEQHRSTMQLGGDIQTSIRKHDYETLVQDYQKAKRLAQEARGIAEQAQGSASLTDTTVRKIIVTAKMWHDVETQIGNFKRDALRQLSNVEIEPGSTQDDRQKTHTELISVLLQLDIEENPIWLWLSSWHDRLRDKVSRSFERARLDIEVLRRRIGNGDPPPPSATKAYLQSAMSGTSQGRTKNTDSAKVIQFWELVENCLSNLLQHRGGLLGEITDFWDNAKSFIDGRAQKSLPNAVWSTDESRGHLYLSGDHSRELQNGAAQLVLMVRECVLVLFSDAPIEDISDLFSPVPQTPVTPGSAVTPSRSRSFQFDAAELPPPSPKRGDAWEKFAFWPPHATSLSGVQYLSRILILIGNAASDATTMSVVKENPRVTEQLKMLVGSVRERCVQAVCAAWNNDAEKCKLLEDWTRSAERRDLTNMPARFMAFEEMVLTSMQKVLYISEAMTRPSATEVVVPPSAKLLQMVRSQFVTSLYKALSGTVENAEKTKKVDTEGDDSQALLQPLNIAKDSEGRAGASSGVDRNVRMLLTLSNLNYLRREIIPQLISQFETSFSVKLTEESKTIRDVLGQIDARLFQSYVKPTVDELSLTVTSSVTPPSWLPQTTRPTNAKPYVYDILLTLVLVHTEVSTSATALTNQILSYLLEQISTSLLAAFKLRQSYTLPALMQATLDVELIAQTLSNYTTEKTSEIQSQIYLVLDERTDHDARMRLQGELPEMRATLKKLREGTKGQFGCFKKERRGRSERPTSRGNRQ